jgi:hypothetical protein
MTTFRILASALVLSAMPAVAAAQTGPVPHPFDRCTQAAALFGAGTGSSSTGIVAGGGFGWRVMPRLSIDTRMAWFDRGDGMDAFSASLGAEVSFNGSSSISPFLRAGAGVYRLSIDTATAAPPDFYRRRLIAGGSRPDSHQAFTDPAVVLGGGVSIFVTRRVALRPEFETTIAFRNSRSHAVTAIAIQLAYHFEDHRITPVRK